jgi:hypothetical protein
MNLHKIFLVGLAALAMLGSISFAAPATAADHPWGPHIAVSMHGDEPYFSTGADEEDARVQAMFNCQVDYGANGCTRAISVPSDWYLVALACDNGSRIRGFVSASEWDYTKAYANAYQKVRNAGWPSNCWSVGEW